MDYLASGLTSPASSRRTSSTCSCCSAEGMQRACQRGCDSSWEREFMRLETIAPPPASSSFADFPYADGSLPWGPAPEELPHHEQAPRQLHEGLSAALQAACLGTPLRRRVSPGPGLARDIPGERLRAACFDVTPPPPPKGALPVDPSDPFELSASTLPRQWHPAAYSSGECRRTSAGSKALHRPGGTHVGGSYVATDNFIAFSVPAKQHLPELRDSGDFISMRATTLGARCGTPRRERQPASSTPSDELTDDVDENWGAHNVKVRSRRLELFLPDFQGLDLYSPRASSSRKGSICLPESDALPVIGTDRFPSSKFSDWHLATWSTMVVPQTTRPINNFEKRSFCLREGFSKFGRATQGSAQRVSWSSDIESGEKEDVMRALRYFILGTSRGSPYRRRNGAEEISYTSS